MRIAYFCFILAALAGTTGISMGIYMGINEDFTLAPSHAHLNLLGWVTMSIYGFYHRAAQTSPRWLAWTQVLLGGLGFPLFTATLGYYLATGNQTFIPVAIVGTFMCLASMVLFAVILISDALSQSFSDQAPVANRAHGW
jgi:hypothetical protein